MKKILYLSLFAAMLLVQACSFLFGREGYFRDRGDDYLEASEIPPMKVPEGLDSAAISELFVIPPISNEFVDLDKEFEVPRPAFDVAQERAQVRIQKLDNRRWILINSSPSLVWPRLKRFLEENQLILSSEDPLKGQLETVWLTLKGETETKDRYRFDVEQGLHANTTEIHVLQITVASDMRGSGHINWPSGSTNLKREEWMVDKLANYLAREDAAPVSLLAQSIGRFQKVSFVQPYQGESFLLVAMDKARVLASVEGSLNRNPFAVEDIHHSMGLIYTSYDPDFQENAEETEDEEPGFFSRLFGLDKQKEIERERRLLHYQIQIETIAPKEIRVFIRDREGNPLPAPERDRLLQKIRQGLL